MHKMSAVSKYILTCSFIAILTIALFGGYAINQYQVIEVREEHEKLELCIRTLWRLLADKGTDFRIVNGTLLADNFPVNGNSEVPDKLQKIFGGVATIFMGDVRVATNVLNAEGKRALGTRLVGPAYEAIFKQGRPYRGPATILGAPYQTAYDPIRNRRGEVIGALFAGVKESEFQSRLNVLKMHLILTLFGMVTISSLFMLLLGRAMKRAEEVKTNQIKFQQTLMNTIPNPVFYKDTSCRYLGCNTAFEEYVGCSHDELIGNNRQEISPRELADRYRQQDLALLENSGQQAYEDTVRYADGTLRHVIFNKATYEGNDGAVAGLIGVIVDITERKTAEDAIINSNQQLSNIVEFLPDATFVVDKNKRVIAWNRAIEQLTGVEKRDIMGKGDYAYAIPFYGKRRPILIDLLGEDENDFKDFYNSINKVGRTLSAEAHISSFRNGTDMCFWSTATSLFDKHGNTVGAIQSIRDITERRRNEAERSRLQAQLHYSQIMGEVMIQLGHDLKTPLTPLLALLPLLRDKSSDPELKRAAEICCKSAYHMRELSDKALRLAKLSSVTIMTRVENIALASSVNEYIHDSGLIAAKKNLHCENLIDPAIVVHVVPVQLRELFVNLISNAIRYSPRNGVIRIVAEHDGNSVTVAVQDNGVGLAPEHLECIFNEFFKTDESRHNLTSLGLGLSICKRIVLNHNGRIWAESPGIGQGTKIMFTLPLFAV